MNHESPIIHALSSLDPVSLAISIRADKYYEHFANAAYSRIEALLQQQESDRDNQAVRAALNEFTVECKQVPDAVIDELLRECLIEADGFVRGFGRIFEKFGLMLKDENCYPGPWGKDRIADMKARLGLVEKPKSEETSQPQTDIPPKPGQPICDEVAFGEPEEIRELPDYR
jgi:hypothetical protein